VTGELLYLVFWSKKPTIFIVCCGCWRLTMSGNTVWDSVCKCVRHSANPQIQRARVNYHHRAIGHWLQMHTFTATTTVIKL